MSERSSIAVESLSVRYRRKVAIRECSFSVAQGSLYALLGRNGAGKSSVVHCLMGFRKPYSGSMAVLGLDPFAERKELMARVGYVPEKPNVPGTMSAEEAGKLYGKLHQRWMARDFEARLERFGIDSRAAVSKLSRGQRTQVQLSLALATKPELLILDDPTLGLDVVAKKSIFQELIDELADRRTTALVTTHELSSIERLATHYGILRDGVLEWSDSREQLEKRFRRVPASEAERLAEQLSGKVVHRSTGAFGQEAVLELTNEGGEHLSKISLEELFEAITSDRKALSAPESRTLEKTA